MITHLRVVTILVRNQDEALAFYMEKLGLHKGDDADFGGIRWLTVRPANQPEVDIYLSLAEESQLAQVGQGTLWAFSTHSCQADYETLQARGVTFFQPPSVQPWGIEAGFEDLYGNRFLLIQPQATQ